ncbi:MAG: SRPBCC domain-containing protein [Chitinophagales bacterium]
MINFDKQLKKEIIINAPVAEVWKKWSTTEGIVSFFAPKADIELAIGGKFELYFMLDNPYGEQGSEDCKVLSFLPEKMLSFSWNAPPQFPTVRKQHHWYVLEFDAINKNETQLQLTGIGWQNSEEWNAVYDYFDAAWSRVLDNLKKSLE